MSVSGFQTPATGALTLNYHTYQVFDITSDLLSWEEIKASASMTEPTNLCTSTMPHVVTITSEEENTFVQNLFDSSTESSSFDWALIGLEQEGGEPPMNDLRENAIPITGNGLFQGTTSGSTIEEVDTCASCVECRDPVRGVWYKVTAGSGASRITASTCNAGTDFDTQINVYSGFDCIDSNDDFNDLHELCRRSSLISWSVAPGEEYHLLVYGIDEYTTGDFSLSIEQRVTPSNDACENAISITGSSSGHSVITGMTHDATSDSVTCNTGTQTMDSPGVWYKLTADSANSLIAADTCGTTTGFDTKLSVYRGENCTSLACVANNDDYEYPDGEGLCALTSGLSWTASNAGEQYYLLVHGYGSNDYGDFTLNIKQQASMLPSNDLCENSIPISGSGSVSGSTQNASVDDEALCLGACGTADVVAPGVWYRLSAATDTTITVSTGTCNANTNFATQLSVFSGSCMGLVCVDGDNSADRCGYQSAVSWSATTSTPYYILVHGRNIDETGDFVLDILEDNSPAEPYSWITSETLSYTNWAASGISGGDCAVMDVWSGEWEDMTCDALGSTSTVSTMPPENYAVVVEWDCAPPYFDFSITVDSITISLTATTNFAEAITIQYTYPGVKPSFVADVNFTYDILQIDCNSAFAPAGNTSKALYFTAFNESITDEVTAKLGIDLDQIEKATDVWSHPNNDERLASLKFCGRWNIYVDDTLYQFHQTAVNATIILKEDGGFSLDSYTVGVGLDRNDANVRNKNVDISFPVDVALCDDSADPVTTPQVFNQGTPIQLCLELQTPTPVGVFLQSIHNMTYSATIQRDNFCSSSEQDDKTLSNWVHHGTQSPHDTGCEAICRLDPNCKTWMWRNSGNACYTSSNPSLFDKNGCCNDHHAFFFGPEYCDPPLQEYDQDPVTLITGGTMQYGSTATVDCLQKAGLCRIKFLAKADMYLNAGNNLVIEGVAVVAFGTDPDRSRRRLQEDDGKEEGQGQQLTPFQFTVENLRGAEKGSSPRSFMHNGMLLALAVGGGFAVLITAAAATACFHKCRRHHHHHDETTTDNSITTNEVESAAVAAGMKPSDPHHQHHQYLTQQTILSNDFASPSSSAADNDDSPNHRSKTNGKRDHRSNDDKKYEIVQV